MTAVEEAAGDSGMAPEVLIARLMALRADPRPGIDPAELAGELGAAYLEHYAAEQDPTSLAAGFAELESALERAPDHPVADQWRYDLGSAFAYRAARRRDPGDYERAISLFETLRSRLSVGEPGHDLVIGALAEVHWHRLRLLRALLPDPSEELLPEAERVAATLRALAAATADAELGHYVRLLHGLAQQAVYDAGKRPADLDAAIALLDGALRHTAPDLAEFREASVALCLAYDQRASAADRSGTGSPLVDLAALIEAGSRALDAWPAEIADESQLLLEILASAHHDRWDITDDPADLDHAIECWRRVQHLDPNAVALGICGYLLRERGARSDRLTDLDEAVRLLERSLVEPADEEFDVIRWYELAQAYPARWRLGHDPADLERTAECLDHLLTMELSAEELLSLHNQRLTLGPDLLNAEVARAPDEAPRSGPRLLRWIAEARAFWERAVDIDADLHSFAAAILAISEFYGGWIDEDTVDLDRVTRLLDVARRMSDPPSELASILDTIGALVQHVRSAQHPTATQHALASLARAANDPDADPDTLDLVGRIAPLMGHMWATYSGDRRALRAAKHSFVTMRHEADDPVDESTLFLGLTQVQERVRGGDLPGAAAEIRRLLALVGPGRAAALGAQQLRSLLVVLAEVLTGEAAATDADPTNTDPSTGLGGQLALATELVAVGGRFATAATRRDAPAMRSCAARVAELAVHAPSGSFVRLQAAYLGGLSELEVARADPADVAAARRAADWYQEAGEVAGGPGHPLWPAVMSGQAEAMRRAGDPDLARSRRLGIAALRGHLWQVLLQSGSDDALAAAAEAATLALTVAAWCRVDQAHDDLIAALDSGRGLMLHAAATSRRTAELLVDAGRPDLAASWQDTTGYGRDALTGAPLTSDEGGLAEVPDDLRAQVLAALSAGDPQRDGPFSAVSTDEVRSALTALGADALVYLVPESAAQPGMAVVVPAHGRVSPIVLPDLRVDPGTPVGRYVTAGGRDREIGPVASSTGPVADPSGTSIDDVCRWAWSAAIGPLLAHTWPRSTAGPVRLVLVPVGMLALVPWHGAFRMDGGRRHYAIEDAVFSYTISARVLCATARFPIRPIRSALVVGDPTGDLPYAGAEARAIRDRFHPDATYLGTPAGTGTAEEVLAWAANAGPGGSLLHLACHGRIDPAAPLQGHLVLADGPLTVQRLLTASRLAGLTIDQLFLAACSTSLASGAYDEVINLAAAFLAAGASTVFGSLWVVPDAETSLLMYLVHHHLTVDRCDPADALRRAQLWMLDPQRQPPAGMPAELADRSSDRKATGLAAWAGFIHLGR